MNKLIKGQTVKIDVPTKNLHFETRQAIGEKYLDYKAKQSSLKIGVFGGMFSSFFFFLLALKTAIFSLIFIALFAITLYSLYKYVGFRDEIDTWTSKHMVRMDQ